MGQKNRPLQNQSQKNRPLQSCKKLQMTPKLQKQQKTPKQTPKSNTATPKQMNGKGGSAKKKNTPKVAEVKEDSENVEEEEEEEDDEVQFKTNGLFKGLLQDDD